MTEIWPYWQILYAQTRICPRKWDKLLWDFEIQTDQAILARRLGLILIKKRTCDLVDFDITVDNRMKRKENEKILGSCQRAKKDVEHEGDGDTNYSWSP